MKAKPYRNLGRSYEECAPSQATHVMLKLPGPIPHRMLPITRQGESHSHRRGPCWVWNGSTTSPTLTPSIKSTGQRELTPEEDSKIMAGIPINLPDLVCHSFVTDGKVKFLNDCTHEFAGKTLDLLEVD